MHTIENAVIIPVFTLIIIALISVSGYMHDKVVMRNILIQTSIEYPKCITEDEKQHLISESEKYIKNKTMFLRNVSIQVKAGRDGIDTLTCCQGWSVKPDYSEMNIGNKNMSQNVYRNMSEELIRKTNIIMKNI